jgi:hypothetical protein
MRETLIFLQKFSKSVQEADDTGAASYPAVDEVLCIAGSWDLALLGGAALRR